MGSKEQAGGWRLALAAAAGVATSGGGTCFLGGGDQDPDGYRPALASDELHFELHALKLAV